MNQKIRRYKNFFLMIPFVMSAQSTLINAQSPVITAQEELDLELFETHSPGGKTLFELLDKTKTNTGQEALKNMLRAPLRTKQELEQRQNIIKELTEPTIAQTIAQELAVFKTHEECLHSLFDHQDPIQKAALEEFYFSLSSLQPYNTSPALLTGLQAFNICALFGPLIEHALLHFLISNAVKEKYHIGCNHDHHHDHGHDHDHVHAGPASLLIYNVYNAAHFSFHLLGAKGIYDHIKQKALVIKNMQASLISANQCVQSMQRLYALARKNPLIRDCMPHYDAVARLFDAPSQLPADDTSAQLIEILKSNTFQGQASVWSNIGNVLAAYHLLEHAHALRHAFAFVGAMDAHASVAMLYSDHQEKFHSYTFPTYLSQATPQVSMAHVWNPHLGNACCTHSMTLGTGAPNISIITGDNAAGKSTMIKSMAFALLLGQTLTIAPADSLRFTPFAKIYTAIKHADNIQAGTSLFVTESLKAQALLDSLETMQESEFMCAIIDELFKSTSFEKGQKTAYDFIYSLSNHSGSLALIATHYEHLKDLQTQRPTRFKNYTAQARTKSQGGTTFELSPA